MSKPTGRLSIEDVTDAFLKTKKESLDHQDSYFYRRLTERLNEVMDQRLAQAWLERKP